MAIEGALTPMLAGWRRRGDNELSDGGLSWSAGSGEGWSVRENGRGRVVDGGDAAEWLGLLSGDAAAVCEWQGTGLDLEQVRCWIDHGIVDPHEAEGYAALGLDPGEARAWSNAWVGSGECEAWMGMGLGVEEADPWVERGLLAEEAAAWVAAGVTAEGVDAWVELAGSTGAAAPWVLAGMSLEETASALALPEGHPRRPSVSDLSLLAALRS